MNAREDLLHQVREILFREWDPIGVNGFAPRDEYDSYAPAVCRLLEQAATEQEIADQLGRWETVSMGLSCADEAHNRQVARRLLGLRSKREAHMRLHLVDINSAMVEAWREAFRPHPEVDIQHADLLAVAENTVVSPANSFGFMDGGIDRSFVDFFGVQIQSRVQDAIARRPEGLLPVGASLVVRTGHAHIPFLIVAPTMLGPERVASDHSYRAMRAILRVVKQFEEVSREVYCPGLGTGIGGVPPGDAAREMAQAYADWKRG